MNWNVIKRFWSGRKSESSRPTRLKPSNLLILNRLSEAAEDVTIVKAELPDGPDKEKFVQAQLYLAAADVLKLIADLFRSYALGQTQIFTENVLETSCTLYRDVLALIEKSRRELAMPSDHINPVVMENMPGVYGTSREYLLLFQDTARRLEETFGGDTTQNPSNVLKDLLARLKSKTNMVLSITGYGYMEGEIDEDNRFWAAKTYEEILLLWFYIVQEGVSPGITASVKIGDEEIDPSDVWLMTDPVARARYERKGRLDQLENDIRYESMRGSPWQREDIELLKQLKRLESKKIIRKTASFWSVSPHPSIYRALEDGEFRIGKRRYPFLKGQHIVWACRMTRDMANVNGPVLTGDFQSKKIMELCAEMSNAMMGRGMKSM